MRLPRAHSSNQKLQLQIPPQKVPTAVPWRPITNRSRRQRALRPSAARPSVLSTTAAGVQRWKRAITNGIVSSQIVALTSVKCLRPRLAVQNIRAGQFRFSAINRSKVCLFGGKNPAWRKPHQARPPRGTKVAPDVKAVVRIDGQHDQRRSGQRIEATGGGGPDTAAAHATSTSTVARTIGGRGIDYEHVKERGRGNQHRCPAGRQGQTPQGPEKRPGQDAQVQVRQ